MGRKPPLWELCKDAGLEAEGIPYMAELHAGTARPAPSTLHMYRDFRNRSPVLCALTACLCQGAPGTKSVRPRWVKSAQQTLL